MEQQVSTRKVSLGGYQTTLRTTGARGGEAVVFVHGMFVSSLVYAHLMQQLPSSYYCLAYDFPGCGDSESPPPNPTLGLADFAEELRVLMTTEEIPQAHIIGWSMGGGIALQFAISHPEMVKSLVLVATMSPYGIGGTKDEVGTPCWSDYAGSGSGPIHPKLAQAIQEKDMSLDNPFSIPNMWNSGMFKPPFHLPEELASQYYAETAKARYEAGYYLRDYASSENWPGYRPGTHGILNAVAAPYCNLSSFAQIPIKPPVLWIRGDSDAMVSDQSRRCPGVLGEEGFILNWPGNDVFPPQPMLKQIRYMLKTYEKNGGRYQELVFEICGHTPHIEKEEEFLQAITSFFQNLTITA